MRETVRSVVPMWLVCLSLMVSGCATPVGVERVDPRTVHRGLTRSVLSTGELSNPTQNVLRRTDLVERFEEVPEAALAELHARLVEGRGGADEVFALAELSFRHAEATGQRAYFLAATVYAYAFLFPHGAEAPPRRLDPRARLAADLYNRGLTGGLATAEGAEVMMRSGVYELPFGELWVTLDPDDLRWGERRLVQFVPVAELEVIGLRNRYRQAGIGAPLAASTVPLDPERGFQDFVAPRAKVPVTAVLRLEDPRRQLGQRRLQASLEVYAASEADSIEIDGREVPLEVEPTAALAYTLSQSRTWEWEYQGFLFGDLFAKESTQLVAVEPYKPGRIPVVFVHGTASSPGRWADMLNDLQNDPRIRERFQFWFFFYNTGNPIPYSALQLREALEGALARLDPEGQDPALRQMVVIGHSQGGLLAKLIAIDTGDRFWNAVSRKPLDELTVKPETRQLLRRALFLKPLPFVRRVVFIATPQHGAYMAGNWISHWVARLVRLPGELLGATADAFQGNPDAFQQVRVGSIYGMTPGNPAIQGLAGIPVASGIAAHSIIAVQGDGPFEDGNDGVVEYQSAHIDGVDSERVVRSGHSTQSNPHTIEEVRRILLLHAAEACAAGIGCPQPPAREDETP